MIIYLASDHRGFRLKNYLKNRLADMGFLVEDLGNTFYDENDDYPDFAKKVALKISYEPQNRGIVICGSGVGVCIVANKFKNIRCALVSNSDQAFDARNDDDCNILALAADFLNEDLAFKIAYTFLNTSFSNDSRHFRRINKIFQIEQENFKE